MASDTGTRDGEARMSRASAAGSQVFKIDAYIARLVTGPFFVFMLILTGVVWLTQSLELLNDVIEQGQNVGVFLYLSVLVIPSILVIVLPIGLFFAVVYCLYRLRTDSELVVMYAAGMSRWQVARAIFGCAVGVMLLAYLVNMLLLPMAMRDMRDLLLQMRTEFASSLLQAGEFTTPAPGLTVFVEVRKPGGDLEGLLVHDNRDKDKPVSYIADRGQLIDTPEGPRLVMLNGNIQRRDAKKKTDFLYFDKYTFDLSQFENPAEERYFKAYERYLPELLWPDRTLAYDNQYANELIAEGHARITSPLYALIFAAIAMAGLLPNEFSRRGYGQRIVLTIALGLGVRLLDLAAVGWATRTPMLISVQYLIPLVAFAIACAIIGGWKPVAMLKRVAGNTQTAPLSGGTR
ncbi:LPS export ABC transporter permease LptF [Pyruvatibacter mobilis]|uniref:LPS export ABC transporter permease LptF n=1 Tax=Pyruvatibacter mobilis TaxID=1712261 RepID=UPI003BA85ADA